MAVIDIVDLHKAYGRRPALRGVSLGVPDGALYGLVGADGAGKTTLMRICATLVGADHGAATVLGYDIRTGIAGIRREIGYMPQRFSLYGDLSVGENMNFFADIFGVRGAERSAQISRLLDFSHLGRFIDRRAAHLSGGMKQKLALSCALIHQPRLLILDEPTTGVDPVSRDEFWRILRELNKEGISILVSTPYMEEAALCAEVAFMHEGRIVERGSPDSLRGSFPLDLFEITRGAEAVSSPADVRLPEDIVLLYPSGGTLHAAARPGAFDEARVLGAVRTVVPQADAARKVAPSMEDVFFMLLSKQEPA